MDRGWHEGCGWHKVCLAAAWVSLAHTLLVELGPGTGSAQQVQIELVAELAALVLVVRPTG